jgi:hypothetical protein
MRYLILTLSMFLILSGCKHEAKFQAGQCVHFVNGFLSGCAGRVDGFDESENMYHFEYAKCLNGYEYGNGWALAKELEPFDGCEDKK